MQPNETGCKCQAACGRPTHAGGKFVDRGSQYRSVIFYANGQERQLAETSTQASEAEGRFDNPVATEILPLGPFYPAEGYHQDYSEKNPIRYRLSRAGAGRDQFLEKVWADRERAMAPVE